MVPSQLDARALPLAKIFLLIASILTAFVATAETAPVLPGFLAIYPADSFVPGADAYGPMREDLPVVPVLKASETIGYAFVNSDLVGSIGYSSRPIQILLAVDPKAVILSAVMVRQSEPMLQSGRQRDDVDEMVAAFAGRDLTLESAAGGLGNIRSNVSGVTVSVRAIEDSVVRSGLKVASTLGLGGLQIPKRPEGTYATVNAAAIAPDNWDEMLAAKLISHLELSNAAVDAAFAQPGQNPLAARYPAHGAPTDTFINLYAAAISVPGIAERLLTPSERARMESLLEEGRDAILLAARGGYSWRGNSFGQDGIFNRIELVQGDKIVRFSSRDQINLPRITANGAPALFENSILAIPDFAEFDPTQPWRLQLLVQRSIGPTERVFLTYSVDYALPPAFISPATVTPEMLAVRARAEERAAQVAMRIDVWKGKAVEIAGLATMLAVLSAAFFFQSYLTRSARITFWFRIGYLATTLVFLGWYADAQLSIVNLMALLSTLQAGFDWETFLRDPMSFILWFSVAAALIFWGRGAYCGWLCPFGAMQELTNRLAKLLHIPQWTLPWGLNERLWAVKYIIFLALFGVTLTSLDLAIKLAEVEPFRTAIVMKFARSWPYLLYLSVLLFIGLFVERFFCRYLCPLGAALAIPARLRLFDWIKRYRECGSPCQICSKECMVQAIHPTGEINPNECLNCLHCQVQYQSKTVCPVIVKKQRRREALRSAVL